MFYSDILDVNRALQHGMGHRVEIHNEVDHLMATNPHHALQYSRIHGGHVKNQHLLERRD